MTTSRQKTQRRFQWGSLTPRTVEYEFDRLVTEMLEKLPGGAELPLTDPQAKYVSELRSINAVRTDDPTSLASIEEALRSMLMDRGRAWNEELRAAGVRWPTDDQWQQMARMAVVRAFLHLRSWGEFTLPLLTKRLGDAVRDRRRQRSEILGVAANVREVDEEQRVAGQGFQSERAKITDEMRNAGVREPDQFEWHALQALVLEEVFSYRRLLEAYEEHATAKNMMVVGGRPPVYELADGRRIRGGQPIARDGDDLERMIETLCGTGGFESKTWNQRYYELELSLPDGSRLTALKYITDDAPYLTIRRLMMPTITLGDYRHHNPPAVVALLEVLMDARLSILVVGGMNSGKTTMLRALGSCFELLEPVYVAESVSELRYHIYPDVYPCESIPTMARRPGLHDAGGVSLDDVIVSAQRSNASRIVVGEIRGPEVKALLKAAQLGHPILSTVHGHNAADGLQNVARYHEQYTSASFENSLAQLCASFDAVITMATVQDRFVVSSVGLVIGMKLAEAGQPVPEIDFIVNSDDRGLPVFHKQHAAQLSDRHDHRIYAAGIEERVFGILGSPAPSSNGSTNGTELDRQGARNVD